VGSTPGEQPCLSTVDRAADWGEQVLVCQETGLVWEARARERSWDFQLTDDGVLRFYELFVAGEVRAPKSWLIRQGESWAPQWTGLLEQLRVLAYEPNSMGRDLVVCNILLLAEVCGGPPNLANYARAHGLVPRDAAVDVTGARDSLLAAHGLEIGLRSLETAIPSWFEFSAEHRHRSLEDDLLDHTVDTVVLLGQPRDERGQRVLEQHIRSFEPYVQRHWALIDRLIADVEEWLDSEVIDEHAGWLHDWGDVCRRLTLGQHIKECYLRDSHEFRLQHAEQIAGAHIASLYDLGDASIPLGMPRHHWWWFGPPD
jgi:hypothetical protein